MKKFQFKMQPLLKYREYLERLAQQKTAKAQMDVKNCEQNIDQLKRTREQQADAIEQNVQKGIGASQFQQYYHYLVAVETTIEEEKYRKITLNKILNEKLMELKKKSVDKRAMELYREKLLTQYTREMIQSEQKELDEISTLKSARTKAE